MGIKYKVFIGNIPSNIDETGLSQRLEKHGKIKSLKLRKTKSANFAVVLFASRKVNKSFLTYDKTDSDIFFENKSSDFDIRKTTSEKRELDIRKCGYPQRIKKSTRICVQNIPLSATDESLVSALKVFGQIKDCRIVRDVEQKSMGFGFVEFCEKKHNFKALIAKIVLENNLLKLTKVLPICLNDEKSLTKLENKTEPAQNLKRKQFFSRYRIISKRLELKRKKLIVENLPENCTKQQLKFYLERYGKVDSIVLKKNLKQAIVVFQLVKSAKDVLDEKLHDLDGSSLEIRLFETKANVRNLRKQKNLLNYHRQNVFKKKNFRKLHFGQNRFSYKQSYFPPILNERFKNRRYDQNFGQFGQQNFVDNQNFNQFGQQNFHDNQNFGQFGQQNLANNQNFGQFGQQNLANTQNFSHFEQQNLANTQNFSHLGQQNLANSQNFGQFGQQNFLDNQNFGHFDQQNFLNNQNFGQFGQQNFLNGQNFGQFGQQNLANTQNFPQKPPGIYKKHRYSNYQHGAPPKNYFFKKTKYENETNVKRQAENIRKPNNSSYERFANGQTRNIYKNEDFISFNNDMNFY